MRLEQIAQTYGMNDYYDVYSGNVYQLSKAIDNGDGTLNVPVYYRDRLVGYARMEKTK